MKIIPGAPQGSTPLWLEPTPYYGPKDKSQDIRGLEMEKKYTGTNLRRYDKLPFEQTKKDVDKKHYDAVKAFFDSLDKDKSS
jgi:hypothetical protein